MNYNTTMMFMEKSDELSEDKLYIEEFNRASDGIFIKKIVYNDLVAVLPPEEEAL